MKKRMLSLPLACLLSIALLLSGTLTPGVSAISTENIPTEEPLSNLNLEDDEAADKIYEISPHMLETDTHVPYFEATDDLLHPYRTLTRSETADMIYKLLRDKQVPATVRFIDVPADASYATAVNVLGELGILLGFNGKFRPQDRVTRGEFVTILARFFPDEEIPEEFELPFSDVSKKYWGYEYICTAYLKGWINGYQDGTFRPNAGISRIEAITVINGVLGRQADRKHIDADGKILKFLDLPYNHWAYYQVMEAVIPHTHTKDESTNAEVWIEYQVPAAKRAQGFYSINGELYCVKANGAYARNESVGYLKFDDNGRYTTGNAELDLKLTAIVKREIVESDTRLNNLKRLYDHVCDDYRYLAETHIANGATGWEPKLALNMINKGRGNCYSYGALFAMLARKLGYQAVGMSGLARNSLSWGWIEHGWTQIELDGKLYVCDTELEGVFAANRNWNWDLFMKPYSRTVIPRYMVRGNLLG